MDSLNESPLDSVLGDAATKPSDYLPSYYMGADNHNLPSKGFAFTDPSTWGTTADHAGKFILASAYSAGNSFYNTGVAIGNWFGADLKENSTAQGLADLDSDLGQYYLSNSQAVDTAGFVVGSFIPGLSGVKLLNIGSKVLRSAVKTGTIGGNLGKTIGLLRPATDFAEAAGKEMAAAQASFGGINANIVKSIASAYGSSVLEMGAFQTAVTASMFKSPVLSDADGWDITKDIVLSSLELGGIGAAFGAAKTYGIVRKIVKAGDLQEKPFATRSVLPKKLGASDNIISAANDLDNLPDVQTSLKGDESPEIIRKLERIRSQTEDKLVGSVRENIRTLAGADEELGNQVADVSKGLSTQQVISNFQGVQDIGRLSSKIGTEGIIKKVTSAAKNLLPGFIREPVTHSIQFVKLTGEDAGDIVTDAPLTPNLADTVDTAAEVKQKIASYKFNTKQIWNPTATPEGVDHLEAESRYWWAQNIAKVTDGMKLAENDIPLQEKLLQEWKKPNSPISHVTLVDKDGMEYEVTNSDDLLRGIRASKQYVADYLKASQAAGNSGITDDAIAKIANVKKSWLYGERDLAIESKDMFAIQSANQDYNQQLVANGFKKAATKPVDLTLQPSWMKVGIDHTGMQDVNGMVLSAAAYLTAKSKLAMQAVENVVAKGLGDLYQRFLPIESNDIAGATRFGAGPSRLAAASANYGTIGSKVESIGSATSDAEKNFRDATSTALQAPLYKLGQNTEAAIEYEAVKNYVHSTAETYILGDDGLSLVHRDLHDYNMAVAAGKKGLTKPVLQEGARDVIPIQNPEVAEVIAAEIDRNGSKVVLKKELRAAQGLESNIDPRTWYPNRPNPKDYKHYALVVDDKATGGSVGQKSMLHAASGGQLEQMIDKVNALGDRYKVRTGADLKQYFEEEGLFEYDKTLHENYIDADLKKQGINNQFFQQTDPQKIVDDILNHHLRDDSITVRELVNAKYQPQFETLRDLGAQYTNIEASKYGGSYRYAENVINNPYVNIIKTALNIKQTSEYPIWQGLNQLVDSAYSKAHFAIADTFNSLKSSADLGKVNDALSKYGMKSAAYSYDSAMQLLANHSAPKEALSKFVRGANAILSNLTLGLDPANALVNGIGANVMLGSETQNIIKRISQGDAEAVGKLAQLKDVQIPGTPWNITSASKLISGVYRDFFQNHVPFKEAGATTKALDDFYILNGWIKPNISELRAISSDATLTGNESVKELDTRMSRMFANAKKFSDWGYGATGNKYAETMNRWVAARVMHKISNLALEKGIISPQEQLSYINTFVNRTQGNFLASQRPILFQGPIGNAIGLFQTYQFNLMQNLFRYVGEGSAKDSAMLLGLQGTLFGLNGLPAFNAINTHIVGTLSGNPKHTDLYSSTYGVAGQQAGDWLLYGLPSNLLHTGLYSRGDINPRQVTVIPTNPADVPIINATTTFLGNLKNTVDKLGAGGSVWETILQGLEHQGLSRPLAGFAQIAQETTVGKVTATSRQGTILGQNDLFSIASMSRLAGSRPIDEAIINDAAFRTNVYKAADTERKKVLDEAIKASVLSGTIPSANQYSTFAARYAELGGDQKRFNQYMLKQITSTNTPQAERIMEQLKSPYSQNMQQIMGGRDLFNQ